MSEVTWFKVLTDIFSDDKIKILQSMPEGDSLLVMWFKVLSQAGKTNDGGYIYLKKNIPYTSAMFSTLFGKQQQLVEFAMRTFSEFGMIDIDDKGYVFVTNWEKHQSVDKLERIKEKTKIRVQNHREKKKLELQDGNATVTLQVTQGNATEIEVDLDLELEKEKDTTTGMIKILNSYCSIHGKSDIHLKSSERSAMDFLSKTEIPIEFILESMQALYNKKAQDGEKVTSFLYYPDAIADAWKRKTTIVEFKPSRQQSYPIAVGQAVSNLDETNDILAEMERLKEVKRQRLAAQKGESQ